VFDTHTFIWSTECLSTLSQILSWLYEVKCQNMVSLIFSLKFPPQTQLFNSGGVVKWAYFQKSVWKFHFQKKWSIPLRIIMNSPFKQSLQIRQFRFQSKVVPTGDTSLTGVVTSRLTSGKISSASLTSECRSKNRDSSDQATFFKSSIV